MAFDWMQTPRPRPDAATRRLAMYRRELVDRAGLLYRLGYSQAAAAARLEANVAWDFDTGAGPRPHDLGPAAIAQIVSDTYARRPASP